MTSQKSLSKLLANQTPSLLTIVCFALTVGLAGGALAMSAQGRGQQGPAVPPATAMKAYAERVKEYVALQNKLDGGLPALKPREETSKIEAHQAALAARIRDARATAKQGDVFGDAAPFFKAIVAEDAKSRSARDTNAALEEVPPTDPPRVNVAYPETKALATVPPLLLERFGVLPDGLEYRFLGRDLVLRDTKANIVVDFISDAVPVWKKS